MTHLVAVSHQVELPEVNKEDNNKDKAVLSLSGLSSLKPICFDNSTSAESGNALPAPSCYDASTKQGPTPAKLSAEQPPSNVNDSEVEIVDLVNDAAVPNSVIKLEDSSKPIGSRHIQEKEVVSGNKFSVVSCKENASEMGINGDEDVEIVCLEKEDVIDIDKDCVSGAKGSDDMTDTLSISVESDAIEKFIKEEGIILLSEDDNSSKESISSVSRKSKKKHKRNKKAVNIASGGSVDCNLNAPFSLSNGYTVHRDSFGFNLNLCNYGSKVKSSGSVLLEKNNNVDVSVNNLTNFVKSPTEDFSRALTGIVDDNLTKKREDDDLSVIELDVSKNIDEINLISDDESDVNYCRNDVENNSKVNNNSESVNYNKCNSSVANDVDDIDCKKGKKRFVSKRALKCKFENMNKEDLIKEGFTIVDASPVILKKKNAGKKTKSKTGLLAIGDLGNSVDAQSTNNPSLNNYSVNLKTSSLLPNSSSSFLAQERTSNSCAVPKTNLDINWSRPGHFMSQQRLFTESLSLLPQKTDGLRNSMLTGVPMIVRNVSTSGMCTANRKRKSPEPQVNHSSPSKILKIDSVGSNVCVPADNVQRTGLRPVVIDASNVAFR